VISAYCADSATNDRATWETFLDHIGGPGPARRLFLNSALRRCQSYVVGTKRFPSANIDESDLRAVLEPAFACPHGAIQARQLSEQALAEGDLSSAVTGIIEPFDE
jgi:hypothetical protein